MKAVVHTLKRHPVVIVIYIMITFYCCRATITTRYFHDYLKHHPGISGIAAGGEVNAWGDVGMFLFSGTFFLVCGCLAIAYKAETKFYLWLGLISILQPIIFLQIGDIHAV